MTHPHPVDLSVPSPDATAPIARGVDATSRVRAAGDATIMDAASLVRAGARPRVRRAGFPLEGAAEPRDGEARADGAQQWLRWRAMQSRTWR